MTVGAGGDHALEVDEMNVPATNDTHEFNVAPESHCCRDVRCVVLEMDHFIASDDI
jgi:hypothetical protein